MMQMKIGDIAVDVAWEENESVEALKKLCTDEPLTIKMSMYGGFEQVGSLGSILPRNDRQTATSAGDIVLYSGNQMVVFYGSNSWSYTRLGHITDKNADEMSELLGNRNITITIFLQREYLFPLWTHLVFIRTFVYNVSGGCTMKGYLSIQETSYKWNVSERRVNQYVSEGRIPGVERFGRSWAIPEDAEKPTDPRKKKNKR